MEGLIDDIDGYTSSNSIELIEYINLAGLKDDGHGWQSPEWIELNLYIKLEGIDHFTTTVYSLDFMYRVYVEFLSF